MDPKTNTQINSQPESSVCSICHQTILPTYYFCPNCGTKVHAQPLSTSVLTQTWIYAFSIILPSLLFLFIPKWPGMKYVRSEDPKARRIGIIAWVLIIVATFVTIWLTYYFTQVAIKSAQDSLTADMGGYLQ